LRPKDLGFRVSFEWKDRRPGSIDFNRPFVEVQEYRDGAWKTATDEDGIPQDDRGMSIEIRVDCGSIENCERWRAIWFTKTLGSSTRHRFRVLPRYPLPEFYSSEFTAPVLKPCSFGS
jgi:hypothetical protein